MVAAVPICTTNLGPVVLKPALDREDMVAHTCYPSPEETEAKRTTENSRPLCDLHSEFQEGQGCTVKLLFQTSRNCHKHRRAYRATRLLPARQPPDVLSLLLTVLLQGCAELRGSKDTIVKS